MAKPENFFLSYSHKSRLSLSSLRLGRLLRLLRVKARHSGCTRETPQAAEGESLMLWLCLCPLLLTNPRVLCSSGVEHTQGPESVPSTAQKTKQKGAHLLMKEDRVLSSFRPRVHSSLPHTPLWLNPHLRPCTLTVVQAVGTTSHTSLFPSKY